MKQTLPAKLIAQFAKLQIVYQQATVSFNYTEYIIKNLLNN